jgi:hypothetical protein
MRGPFGFKVRVKFSDSGVTTYVEWTSRVWGPGLALAMGWGSGLGRGGCLSARVASPAVQGWPPSMLPPPDYMDLIRDDVFLSPLPARLHAALAHL